MNSATKILLIGDGADDQQAQRRAISHAEPSWQLDFCGSGRAALNEVNSLQPHCIILDYQLPDMSGLECFQAIRKHPGNTMPVLMLAAQDHQAIAADALNLGVQDYLFKDARGNYLALLPAVLKKTLREHRIELEKKSAQVALSQLSRKYEHLFFDVTDGIILSDENRIIESINPAGCKIFGYQAHELCGQSVRTILHPADHIQYDQEFTDYLESGVGTLIGQGPRQVRGLRKNGLVFPLEVAITEISFDGRRMFAGVMRDLSDQLRAQPAPLEGEARFRSAPESSKAGDITQRRQTEDALHAEKDLAQAALQSTCDAVITVDREARVTFLNPIAERLTGWSSQDACGLAVEQVFVVVNEATREFVANPVKQALAEGKVCWLAGDSILIGKDGIEYCIDNSATPIRADDGGVTGVMMVFHDVTETRALAFQMSYKASHDALTGLWNRSEFELIATRLLHSARVSHQQHALLYLDLDEFKLVNDICGHLAGDQLLRQLSSLLSGNTRKSDTLARLGGDEFGILLDGCPLERAREIAQHLVDTVRSFRFEWDDKRFSVGVSVGLVAITGRATDLQELLAGADAACCLAKDKGRGRVQIFENYDEPIHDRHAQLDWLTRLNSAIEHDQFHLYFQKIFSIDGGGSPQHYEVLLRYQDEQGRFLLPMAFIPAAERNGLLAAIDRWVIKKLFRDPPLALLGAGTGSLLAINLSGSAIADPDFQEFVVQELRAGLLPAERICFEISETAAIANLQRSMHFIQALKAAGCRFALDDFGGGLGSFMYLKSLPVDYLKIDGAMVRGIANDAIDFAMVDSIQRIAKVMGIRTVAKFVECEETLRQLRTIGIDYGQGFELHTPELIQS